MLMKLCITVKRNGKTNKYISIASIKYLILYKNRIDKKVQRLNRPRTEYSVIKREKGNGP